MKKGFTLIEILVSLSLLGIIAVMAIPTFNGFIGMIEDKELDYATKSIVEVINGGSSYARNNRNSSIVIWVYSDKLLIKNNLNKILEHKLPNNTKVILPINGEVKKIYVSSDGHIDSSFTLEINHKNGNEKFITVKVGTAYVSEKK